MYPFDESACMGDLSNAAFFILFLWGNREALYIAIQLCWESDPSSSNALFQIAKIH